MFWPNERSIFNQPVFNSKRDVPNALHCTTRQYKSLLRWPNITPTCAPVAQLDRALDYESRGQRFESFRARQFTFSYRSIECSFAFAVEVVDIFLNIFRPASIFVLCIRHRSAQFLPAHALPSKKYLASHSNTVRRALYLCGPACAWRALVEISLG